MFAAFALGNAATVKTQENAQSGVGESGRASAVIDKSFPKHATEEILIRNASLPATAPAFRAVVADVQRRLAAVPHTKAFESPYAAGNTSWMPLFLFVVLFGLSMDYRVFILSRIREAFDRGSSTEEAVAHGIKSTAGVVTSAAVVMVSVFAIFATLSLVIFKQLGVGLAVAVLLDATLVRGCCCRRA